MNLTMFKSDPWVKNGMLYGQMGLDEVFLDTIFPANKYSISYSGYLADDAAAGGKKVDIDNITWVRAKDFYKKPKLVVDGGNRNDVNLEVRKSNLV